MKSNINKFPLSEWANDGIWIMAPLTQEKACVVMSSPVVVDYVRVVSPSVEVV